jgi:hypothetical protein
VWPSVDSLLIPFDVLTDITPDVSTSLIQST